MLKGKWDEPGRCEGCSAPLKLKEEFLESMPPARVYECKQGHKNYRYMRNLKVVAAESEGIDKLLE